MPETITFRLNERGICSVCGKPAYKGSATKCEDHRTNKPAARREQPGGQNFRIVSDAPPASSSAPKAAASVPRDPKTEKAERYANEIRATLNPYLVQGFAQLCQPIPPENFYQGDIEKGIRFTELGNNVAFNQMEATILGRVVAEFEDAPIAATAKAVAAPVMPYLLAIAAVGVVGFHGLKLVQTRDNLLRQWELLQQGARTSADIPAHMKSGTAEPAPEPPAPMAEPSPMTNGHQAPPPGTIADLASA